MNSRKKFNEHVRRLSKWNREFALNTCLFEYNIAGMLLSVQRWRFHPAITGIKMEHEYRQNCMTSAHLQIIDCTAQTEQQKSLHICSLTWTQILHLFLSLHFCQSNEVESSAVHFLPFFWSINLAAASVTYCTIRFFDGKKHFNWNKTHREITKLIRQVTNYKRKWIQRSTKSNECWYQPTKRRIYRKWSL